MLKKRIIPVLLAILILGVTSFTASASVSTKQSEMQIGKSLGITFTKVQLSATGDSATGQIYDVWFSTISSYYPFYITYIKPWSYQIGNWGYAKGQYTIHGSIGYKGIGEIRQDTCTITIVF